MERFDEEMGYYNITLRELSDQGEAGCPCMFCMVLVKVPCMPAGHILLARPGECSLAKQRAILAQTSSI